MEDRYYCCNEMERHDWYLDKYEDEDVYTLYYNYDYMTVRNIKYCPWCGKEIKND